MPAQSKQQVRLMRLVRGVQTGDTPKSKVDAKVKKMAKDMKPADVKDFAKTPESGLPDKKKQESLNEGEWSKIMAGVKKGDQSGPWSLVVIDGITKKVKHQKDVKVRNAIPAYYEDLKKKFKGDFLSIEDKSGQQVYKGRLVGNVKESAPAIKEGPKVKPKQSITKQEWDKTPKDYKTVIDGVKYKMMNTDKGTSLVSVNVTEAVEDCGCNKSEQSIHTSNKLSLKTAMNGIKTK